MCSCNMSMLLRCSPAAWMVSLLVCVPALLFAQSQDKEWLQAHMDSLKRREKTKTKPTGKKA